MKTGIDVQKNGLYSCDCCDYETYLRSKQMFPRCPKCLSLTVWYLVEVEKEEAA
jgi:hypothetical protein